jgi:uncharacterized membrane protein
LVWLQGLLLYLHIIGATFWFGSGLFLQLVLAPALRGWQFEAQKPLLIAISGRYGKVVGPLAGLTVLFGILRGLVAGVFGNLGSPYGLTFLASIVGAGFVIFVGARFIGPTAEKMAEAATRDDVVELAGRIMRYGRFEIGGMLVMLALMVAMRAGY